MSSWPPEIEREWGLSEVPALTLGYPQGMASFSFRVEALGYIFVFLGIAPPSPTVAAGTSDRPHSLSLYLWRP